MDKTDAAAGLVERLRQHAELHDEIVPHDGEQAQWATDLRTAADELDRLRAETAMLRDALAELVRAVEVGVQEMESGDLWCALESARHALAATTARIELPA